MEFRKRYVYNPKVDLLGKGGFSRVFRANDVLLEREVALKVFNPEQSAQYDLVSEIKKVIKFQQENLCRYYDVAILETINAFGEEEQLQVGVMEYLDGGELKTYLRKNPQHMNKLLCDVLKGLAYLHKRSIIHRDLKPQNILIKLEEDDPVAKITDFGISKAMDASQENASALVGTVEYMAPEQFNPASYGIDGQISTHIDLWSFGTMVYELIEGENLFGSRSKGTSAEVVMSNILNKDYAEKLATLPAPYNEIVGSCLKKRASERAQSADVLLSLLSGNVTDSHLFAGLRSQSSTQSNNDETTLIPGNLQGRIDEVTDAETQLIAYNLPESPASDAIESEISATPVEKVSGNIFGLTGHVPPPKANQVDDDATQIIDLSKTDFAKDQPEKAVPKPAHAPSPMVEKAEVPKPPVVEPVPVRPVEENVGKVNKKEEENPAARSNGPKDQSVAATPVQPVKEVPVPRKDNSKTPTKQEQKNPGSQQVPNSAGEAQASSNAPKTPKPGDNLYKNTYDEYLAQNPDKPFTLNDALAGQTNRIDRASDAQAQASQRQQKPGSKGGLIAVAAVSIAVVAGGIFLFTQNKATQPVVPAKQTVQIAGATPLTPKESLVKSPKPTKTASKTVTGLALADGIYTGRTKNGVPDGKGELKFANGDFYTGGFANSQFSGRGTLITSSGEKYVGNWVKGKKMNGTLYYSDGTLYRGTFKGEMKHGDGKFMFRDATYYEGEFRNDKFNGQGKLFTASGELTKSGTFKDGIMVTE